jgi:threonine dehydratase
VPAGGGGLASAIASVMKQLSPKTKVIAVEPDSCKPYSTSILKGSLTPAEKACRFCSGSSVKETSKTAYEMGKTSVDGFVEVNEKEVARKIIKLYSQGYICEPSGALAVTGLDKIGNLIKGKSVVCLLTGANIDLTKLDEAREMAMVAKGVKNHFQFRLPNKKSVIYELITTCFKESDIISIHYSHRFGKEESQAVVSVESRYEQDVEDYLEKLVEHKFQFENINEREDMLDMFF